MFSIDNLSLRSLPDKGSKMRGITCPFRLRSTKMFACASLGIWSSHLSFYGEFRFPHFPTYIFSLRCPLICENAPIFIRAMLIVLVVLKPKTINQKYHHNRLGCFALCSTNVISIFYVC